MTTIRPLLLERFYARSEFDVRYNLSASDPEPVGLQDLLELADPEARDLWERLALGYVEPDGLPILRAEIARHYDAARTARGVDSGRVTDAAALEAARGLTAADVRPADVVLTTGAQEAIYLAKRVLVGPGDHVVAVGPAYQVLYEGARLAGANVTIVRLEPRTWWELDIDAMIGAIRDDTRLVIVNFPHNPTGAHLTRAEFRRLVTACAERGVRLLSDEVFRGVEPNPELRLPAAVEIDERAISVGDVSKSYGLAGLRAGWIACRDRDVLERIARYRDYTTICGAGPSQVLALVALRARERLQQRARSIVARNFPLVTGLFSRHEDLVEWVPPTAGTTTFPRLRRGDADAFCERLAGDEGVLLAPGSTFEMDGGYFRFGLGHEKIDRAFPALERALDALRRRP